MRRNAGAARARCVTISTLEQLHNAVVPACSVVVAGDIGGPDGYHAGDEAMFAANVARLRTLRPDVEVTAISRDPDWTARRYRVDAIPPIGFPSSPQAEPDRGLLWNQVLLNAGRFRTGGTVNSTDCGANVIAAIARADALIVSGGGNLCSRFAEHVYERMALIEIASSTGRRVLVLGQTLGPDLEPVHADLLARYLKRAAVVGVREACSASLAKSLGIPAADILRQLDDAWFLRPDASHAVPRSFIEQKRSSWIGVTLAPLPDRYANGGAVRSLARQLSAIMRATSADIVFMPHWNALEGPSDAGVMRQIIELLDEPERATLLPVHTAEAICWISRHAAMIITSRYHPTVFALSGAVPCVSIYSDEYSRVRQMGALGHAGFEQHAIDLDSCLNGLLASVALELWQNRVTAREKLLSCFPCWHRMEAAKWSRVARVLGWAAGGIEARISGHDELLQPTQFDGSHEVGVSAPCIEPSRKPMTRGERPLANVSAVILSRDGTSRLERCLDSIAHYDCGEIVVCVDRMTTDQTMRIARRFTDKVYLLQTAGYIEPSLRKMASLCSNEFILRIDDDEALGGDWHREPVRWMAGFNDITHFFVPRRWIVPPGDQFIADPPWFPDFQMRLFRNDPSLITWPDEIHVPTIVKGRGLIRTDRWIDHYNLVVRSREEREEKCRKYRTLRPGKHLSQFYLWEESSVQLVSTGRAGFACAVNRALPLLEPESNQVLADYELGAEIRFHDGGNAERHEAGDWSHAETWGTWTDGNHASLSFRTKQPLFNALQLTVTVQAYVRPKHPSVRVFIVCGNTFIAEWEIGSPEVRERVLTIPQAVVAQRHPFSVAFFIVNPASPKELEESDDGRLLGLGFTSVRLSSISPIK